MISLWTRGQVSSWPSFPGQGRGCVTPLGKAFSGRESRVPAGYYFNKPSSDVSKGCGRLGKVFQESLCFLGLLFQTQVQGGESVLLNSCFWKNRLLERVGQGRQDVEGRAAGLGNGGRWGRGAGGGREEKGLGPWRPPLELGLEMLAPFRVRGRRLLEDKKWWGSLLPDP